ncbi:GIY-YIG nuclease family protein [Pseudomonas sp. Q2-TVG4-2]|uniref:GIY-YIG nuclease family protein n=1 Tax=Pseudomonas sp. Q2-TVG4-2 TaxID=1685699 RepID=UPI0015E7C471|nr:GIY-YIG nuclease family protein [Pseudomonas sp. Q2-TVG4-2]
MIDQKLLGLIASNLCTLAKQVEAASIDSTCSLSVPLNEIRVGYSHASLATMQQWAERSSTDAQYIYRIDASEQVCAQLLHAAFSDAKEKRLGNRAYARLHQASRVLYVGSSRSLMTRLKQHLGFGPRGTYAMQVSHWLPPVEGELHIQAWRFASNVSGEVIQTVEDGLWAASSPMFGRQGAR